MLIESQISVVVPTRNSSSTIRACLESIRAQSVPIELIVVDNYSEDLTVEIALELADKLISHGPERSAQRNAGAALASSKILAFIDSDMVLTEMVANEAIAAIQGGAASVVVPERTNGVGYWARVSAFERDFYNGNESIEAPRFFSRAAFEASGGFDDNMTGAEDWDLGIRTATFGPRVRINSFIVHDEGRVKYFTLCMKKAYYAPGVALFVKKHGRIALGTVTQRPWLRNPRVLLSPLGAGLIALKIGQATAMIGALAWSYAGGNLRLPKRTSS